MNGTGGGNFMLSKGITQKSHVRRIYREGRLGAEDGNFILSNGITLKSQVRRIYKGWGNGGRGS